MKVLLLLAVLVAIDARATPACTVSEWGPYGEWTSARHDASAQSFPKTEKDHEIGREHRSYLMNKKAEISQNRKKCLEDGSCPELSRRVDEGFFECVDGLASSIPCLNIDQMAFLDIHDLIMCDHVDNPIPCTTPEGNDIWGWKDPITNEEYAIYGSEHGTSFVRIVVPENPVHVGFIPSHDDSPSTWRDMKVVNDYVYIVSEAFGHGIQYFDLTKLRGRNTPIIFFEPDDVGHYDVIGNCHNIVSNTDTGYLYAVGCTSGGNGCSGGLHVVNVQDPANPVNEGCFGGDGYVHDAQCVIYTGPDADYQGREICFCYNEEDFTIVDVTDKADMTLVSRTGYSGAMYTHQGWITEDHTVVLLDDELDEDYDSDQTQRTYLWDVIDLDLPVLMNTYYAAFTSIDHNQYIRGDLTYQANYEAGLRILEIDQANFQLTERAFFDVMPSGTTANFFGSWSVYPYFDSGIVVISSIDYGLYVVRPDYAAIGSMKNDNMKAEAERKRYRSILEARDVTSCPHLEEIERQ